MKENDSGPRPLFGVEIVHKTNLYGFVSKSVQQRYIKLTCTSTNAMNSAKSKSDGLNRLPFHFLQESLKMVSVSVSMIQWPFLLLKVTFHLS